MHGRLQPVTHAAVGHDRHVTLDAIRGVAAVIVVWFHMALRRWAPVPAFGHLAVDMFFLLSGFVLALANDPRFAYGLPAREFLVRRMVRLYPVYLVGCALGALALLVSMPPASWSRFPVGPLIANILLLPYPAAHARVAPLFVLDGPAWSLCLEFYVANLLYALAWPRLKGKALALLVVIAVAVLAGAQAHYVNLSGGAGFDTWPEGLARVMASFFGGVLLARVYRRHKPRPSIPSWMILAAVAGLLFAPVRGWAAQPYELACVVLAFPTLIYFGAASPPRRLGLGARLSAGLGAGLGDASYALYVIHIPLLYFIGLGFARAHLKPSPLLALPALVGLTILAYALDRLFDTPVRRRLTQALRGRSAATHGAPRPAKVQATDVRPVATKVKLTA